MSNRIDIVKGTSESFDVALVDDDGEPFDMTRLAGATAEFSVRMAPEDTSDVIAFATTTTPNSLSFKVDEAALTLTFAPSDTSGLDVLIYFYRLRVSLADSTVFDAIEWSPFDVNLGGSAVPAPAPFPNTVKIDENFRLPDEMTYMTPGGSPIENAQVRVYLKSDYDAGKLDVPVGVTTTNAKGGWVNPLLVTPGYTYVARFEKPNEWGPNVKEFFA